MAWRSMLVQKPAKLSLKHGQLHLANDNGTVSIPVEDLTALILETPQVTISSALLSCMQEHGVVMMTCDETHMPNGILHPFQPHSRQSQVAHLQISWSEPLKKRLWQRIIRTKIENQATCLERQGKDSVERLLSLVSRVESGDPKNIEAQAARNYWPALLGKSFRRHSNDKNNAALNYSYAVLRACVARSLVSHGLIPAFGLHHNSDLNAFNLADDIIEVFRPFADYFVLQHIKPDEQKSLSAEDRQVLAGIAVSSCQMDDEIVNITNACDKMAAGLVRAIREKEAGLLPVPRFLDENMSEEE